MTPTRNLKSSQFLSIKQFEEFVFIGNTTNNSVSNSIKQLHNAPNNAISQAEIDDTLKITQIATSKEIARQLQDFQIKIGAIVKLINKTHNGSTVVSLDNKLVGIGAEIAEGILAIRVSQTKL